ncbi:MAG: cytosine permease [Bacillaceae bacterium]|nr:cytosine permease [Bacillaceae bacterium]
MQQTEKRRVAVERFGLDPVPEHLRQTKWYDYAIIQASFSVNAGNFLVPALAVIEGGLPILAAIMTTIVGAGAAFLFVSFLSEPGSKYGIPAQFAIRSIFGTKGAQWISSPVRSITSMYWFSVQTIGGTYVVLELLERFFHLQISFTWTAIFLALMMSILSVIGFDAVKQTTRRFLPILLLGQGIMLVLLIQNLKSGGGVGQLVTKGEFSLSTSIFYASLVFIQYVSGVSASADLTRYAKTTKHGFWGLYTGNLMGFMMTAILGAMSAGLLSDVNPFISASRLTDSPWLAFIIIISAILSMVSINLSNAYTGSFSLLNSIPRLGRIRAAVTFGIIGITLSTFPHLVQEAENFISYLGGLIIPISAVIVVDYLWVKKRHLLDDERKLVTLTINPVAILHVILGAFLYFAIPDTYSPGLVTFVLTGGFYGFFAHRSYEKIKNPKTKVS